MPTNDNQDLIRELKEVIELMRNAGRHIYWADACLRDGNRLGYTEHLKEALKLIGINNPKDVNLSQKLKFHT